MSGTAELRSRVAQLDTELGDPRAALVRFIAVLARITDSGVAETISAADADSALATCQLLQLLTEVIPEVVTGPLAPNRQYWIATGKPANRPAPDPIPKSSRFDAVTPNTAGTKPFDVGLFTSTGVLGGSGMWREYLDLHHPSTLHPTPWHTWLLTPEQHLTVREITTATQWVKFIQSYAKPNGGFLYPDWLKIAADYHAVHLTTRAIAAVQGLRFRTASGTIAPTYWDIESTLWLHWCFSATRLENRG